MPDWRDAPHPRTSFCLPASARLLALALLAIIAPSASAQLPSTQMLAIYPSGGRRGAAVDVKIAAGADLEGVDRLLFSHPGIAAVQKTRAPGEFEEGPQPLANEFTVTIAPDVPVGLYDVRACGHYGVSSVRAFAVGDLPEQSEVEPNNALASANAAELGSVVHGVADGAASDWYRFAAREGQKVVIDCAAERIDSRMDAAVVLYAGDGRELARAQDSVRRDPRIIFRAPADGDYLVQVHDYLYRGGAEYFYRLSIHAGPHIECVFPPVAVPGAPQSVTIVGVNLPGGRPSELADDDHSVGLLEELDVTVSVAATVDAVATGAASLVRPEESFVDGFDVRVAAPQQTSQPALVGVAQSPTTVETEPNNDPAAPQSVSPPCEIAGRFWPARDVDRYEFDARKGDVWWIEVVSQRLGLLVDPQMVVERVVRRDAGAEEVSDVAAPDDGDRDIGGYSYRSSTLDPVFRFEAPEDGRYRVSLRDLTGGSRTDLRNVYRLAIRAPQPDFRLSATPVQHTNNAETPAPVGAHLRRGGVRMIDVAIARRDGFAGPVKLEVRGLPPGVSVSGAVVPAGQDGATLMLMAADDVASWLGEISIIGRADIAGVDVEHEARPGAALWAAGEKQPADARLARSFALSVSHEDVQPFSVEVAEPLASKVSRAGKLTIPVKVVRREGFASALTLTAIGLPANVAAPAITINADQNEGALAIDVAANAAPGSSEFRVQAQSTVAHRRYPLAAERAAAEQKRLEALVAALMQQSDAAKAAVADSSDADKAAKQQAADELAAKLSRAAEAKTAADTRAAEAAKSAEPASINVFETSPHVALEIVALPVAVEAAPAEVRVGDQVDVPLRIARQFDFAGAVEVGAVIPEAAAGVSIDNISIAADAAEGKLTIRAAENAAPGQHALTLRIGVKFNDQDLQSDIPLSLTVTARP